MTDLAACVRAHETITNLMRDAFENSLRQSICARHYFTGPPAERKTCRNCASSVEMTAIINYMRGYQAAGGALDDIWTDWAKE
jgi:hypothetical protein